MAGWFNTGVCDDTEADWPTVRMHLAHQFDSYAAQGSAPGWHPCSKLQA